MRVPAGEVTDRLGIRINIEEAIPTAGILIVKTLYPTGEVGLVIGTSQTQSWIDNIGLIRAADMVIQNDLLVTSLSQAEEDE